MSTIPLNQQDDPSVAGKKETALFFSRWDEKLGLWGQAVYSKSNVLHEKIAKSKMISLLAKKEGWAIMAAIYLFAILPCFPIEIMERAAQGRQAG